MDWIDLLLCVGLALYLMNVIDLIFLLGGVLAALVAVAIGLDRAVTRRMKWGVWAKYSPPPR